MVPAELVAAVDHLADEVLWPAALAVDRRGTIPWAHFETLADHGLFALLAPRRHGGPGLDGSDVRRVLRSLGRGCGATAFAFAQHGGVVGALSSTVNDPLRDRWLPRLCDGALAGTAFAHLRRPGPPPVLATRVEGGWRLDGTAPWATSWGTAAVFSVAAGTDDGRIVWTLVDGSPRPTLRPSEPLSLVAFSSTATVQLHFEGHVVGDDDVLEVADLAAWRAGDRRGAVRPNPLCLGVGDRALVELARQDATVAARHEARWHEVVERADAASAAVDAGSDDLKAIADARSEVILAVQALTTGLMALIGGRSAGHDNPAQLLARQSLFYVIQAQNDDGRQATLRALAPGSMATS